MKVSQDNIHENGKQAAALVAAPKQNNENSGTPFVDNRPKVIAQMKLQSLAESSYKAKHAAPLQAKSDHYSMRKIHNEVALQRKQDAPEDMLVKSTFSNIEAPIQAKRISSKQMRELGFNGPFAGGSWQWNAPGGIHVTAIRTVGAGDVDRFHVRKDTKGGVYNRINYWEQEDGSWTEGVVDVPAGPELEAEMKKIGAETIALIKALIPPKD